MSGLVVRSHSSAPFLKFKGDYMEQSIWLKPQSLAGKTLREQVGILGCELRKCYDLQVMGYVYSNRANINKRETYLKGEIFRLEEEIKRLRDISPYSPNRKKVR
jgi:hypothetical protein